MFHLKYMSMQQLMWFTSSNARWKCSFFCENHFSTEDVHTSWTMVDGRGRKICWIVINVICALSPRKRVRQQRSFSDNRLNIPRAKATRMLVHLVMEFIPKNHIIPRTQLYVWRATRWNGRRKKRMRISSEWCLCGAVKRKKPFHTQPHIFQHQLKITS